MRGQSFCDKVANKFRNIWDRINKSDKRVLIHCVVFSVYDTILYCNSLIHYQKHVGGDHSLIEPQSRRDEAYLALMTAGALCTLIANVPAYFVHIKKAEAEFKGELEFSNRFNNRTKKALSLIVGGSIIFKTTATSTSFQALLYDGTKNMETVGSILQWSGFSLAFIGNLLAQMAVQMESMENWRLEFEDDRYLKIFVLIGTTFYNIPLHILYWNALNLDAIEFGWTKRITLGNMFDDSKKAALACVGIPLLLVAAWRTQVSYKRRIHERLCKTYEAPDMPVTAWQKWSGVVNGLQRSVFMFLALATFFHTLGAGPEIVWGITVLGLYSLAKANISVLKPDPSSRMRLLNGINGGNQYVQLSEYRPLVEQTTITV